MTPADRAAHRQVILATVACWLEDADALGDTRELCLLRYEGDTRIIIKGEMRVVLDTRTGRGLGRR